MSPALRGRRYALGILAAAGLLLSACGTSTRDRALSGGAIGAGVGAIGGAFVGIPAAGAAIGAAAGVGVGVATTPATPTAAPASAPSTQSGSDHVIVTYLTNGQGWNDARVENQSLARRMCGGGAVLIDEQKGADRGGNWLKLVYGCLAKE